MVTPEILNARIKEYEAKAEEFENIDENQYWYYRGKARALKELMFTYLEEYIRKNYK